MDSVMKQKVLKSSVGWTLGQALHYLALNGEGTDQEFLTRWGTVQSWIGKLIGLMIILGELS